MPEPGGRLQGGAERVLQTRRLPALLLGPEPPPRREGSRAPFRSPFPPHNGLPALFEAPRSSGPTARATGDADGRALQGPEMKARVSGSGVRTVRGAGAPRGSWQDSDSPHPGAEGGPPTSQGRPLKGRRKPPAWPPGSRPDGRSASQVQGAGHCADPTPPADPHADPQPPRCQTAALRQLSPRGRRAGVPGVLFLLRGYQ